MPNPSIPLNWPPRTHGLTILVDATACVGVGYCPIKVKVSAASAAPNTRRFTLRISGADFRELVPIQVSAGLELPAGGTSASTVLYVPQFIREQQLNFDFWDEGEHLPDLSGSVNFNRTISVSAYEDERLPPSILCPNSERLQAPDIESWERTLVVTRTGSATAYFPCDLPDSSFDYSSWDVVLISLDELAFVVGTRPKCWTALRQWIAAGGNLWVYDVGEPFRRLGELEKLLDWPLAKVPEFGRKPAAGVAGWHGVDARTGDTTDSIIQQATTPPYYQASDPAVVAAMEKERPGLRKRLQGLTFVKRRLGMGTVVALDTSTPMTEHRAYWDLLKFEFADRDQWHDRHGLSFIGENPGFWNFLIPGVGLAPIGTFEVLITLFVVGIGPVNYFLLRRRHKQNLLMLTVPAGAAVVTGYLMLYAMFADGFAVVCRTRSFTEINRRHGEAACWSRIAYYAGITPSKGLEFPSDTAVYPIAASPDSTHAGLGSGGQIDEGSPRHFAEGLAPSPPSAQLPSV